MGRPQITIPSIEDEVAEIRSWSQKRSSSKLAYVTTVPFIIGSNSVVISTGVQAALPIQFRSRLVAIQLQEFDGTTGSIQLDLTWAKGGPTPVWTSIVGTNPPKIVLGRCYPIDPYNQDLMDATVTNFTKLDFERGDFIRVAVSTVTSIRRLSVALKLRRKEPV